MGEDLRALEAALAEAAPKALESEAAAARAEAADLSVTRMQEETRRAVGAERQRVAGMLYKEALQAHTLEEPNPNPNPNRTPTPTQVKILQRELMHAEAETNGTR